VVVRRAGLRRTFCRATRVALRHCPAFRLLCERLPANGKSEKVARVAAMRKLVGVPNAIARQRSRRNPRVHDA
jgi:hypothetical protein